MHPPPRSLIPRSNVNIFPGVDFWQMAPPPPGAQAGEPSQVPFHPRPGMELHLISHCCICTSHGRVWSRDQRIFVEYVTMPGKFTTRHGFVQMLEC